MFLFAYCVIIFVWVIVMYDDNYNSSSGHNGNKGKFSDRLNKIRRERIKKKCSLDNDDEFKLMNVGRNIIKVILSLPLVVYTHVTDNLERKENKPIDKSDLVDDNSEKNTNSIVVENLNLSDNVDIVEQTRKIKVSKIKDINVSLLRKNSLFSLKNGINVDNLYVKETYIVDNFELKKKELQKEIINLIKKKLVKSVNELEILQSEFYVLNELDGEDIYLNECQQKIKEIKKLLSKVKSLKEKFDYLKEDVDFEYMLEYGDDFLVDKILELKELCTRDDIRQTVEDYKILDEYKFLYLKIDKLQDDVIRFEEYKNKKAEEMKKRDIDFDKLKLDIYDIDRENDRYDDFTKKQELFLRELDEKMMQIDSYEKVTYRLKGFNQLLANSFKYLGLLLVNPLKGLIPGIATQTLVTKNIIHNLHNNLEWEEDKKMVYDTLDYSSSINVAINNLDDTVYLVNSTLEDIIKLKRDYSKKFSKYEGEFSSYSDAIKKLNKMENAILGNKIKIEMMRERFKEKEKQNSDKLKMVKKLNSAGNS